MVWNIVGWLGFGLFMNQSHSHHESEQCDVILCTCEVEKAGDICTCHHHDMHSSDKHSENSHREEVCYFSLPHDSNSTTQGVIVLTKFNALYVDIHQFYLPVEQEFNYPVHSEKMSIGIIDDLFRPPRT